ncbi:DUF1850 domain-containing protein [Mitsuokella sp.]|uniref:DUF1850 domain-containing protein n=1 Tax=Mitsuokella sp. TaxID=2049034 RepID=UPI003D7EC0DD
MRRYSICAGLTALAVIFGLLNVFLTPCLVVRAAGERVAIVEARPGLPFSIHFIHSVQKTPVLENLEVNDARDGFTLLSTKYQSFGVGLPFLEEEGDFREEGNYYVFDHMDRHFRDLSLRTGVGTKLTLTLNGRTYRLYERYAPGTRIDLAIMPLYRGLLGK